MIESKITIAGKEVGIAYCYATEISFANMAKTEMINFDPNNSDHVIYIILSAAIAYAQANNQQSPIEDSDLMFRAKSKEITAAIKEVLRLNHEWYEIPEQENEPEQKKIEGEKKKNA